MLASLVSERGPRDFETKRKSLIYDAWQCDGLNKLHPVLRLSLEGVGSQTAERPA